MNKETLHPQSNLLQAFYSDVMLYTNTQVPAGLQSRFQKKQGVWVCKQFETN